MAVTTINLKAPVSASGLEKNSNSSPSGVLVRPTQWYRTTEGLKNQIVKMLDAPQKYTWGGVTYTDTLRNVVKKVSELTNVPQNILLSFIMVESGGKFDSPITDTAGGLIHWKTKYIGGARNTKLSDEYVLKRMTPAEIAFLKKYNVVFNDKGHTRFFNNSDVFNPYINAYIGAMIISQYLDASWGKDPNGNARVDRIIAHYNWSPEKARIAGIRTKSFKDVYNSVPFVTQAYIGKILGEGGAMDIILNDLKIKS